jgi:hypothetical protein
MEKFIKSNAKESFIINLVMNMAIPSLILWHEKVVYLKEGNPILLPNILGPVVLSAFLTTIGTFFLMTKKRKSGEIDLPINPNTSWLPKALLTGFVIALGLGLLAFIVFNLIQPRMDNIEIPKTTVLIMSAIVGTLTGFATSFMAANRASLLK